MAKNIVRQMNEDEVNFCAVFIQNIVVKNGGRMKPEKIAEKIQASTINHPTIGKVQLLSVLVDMVEMNEREK